eukprot:395487_1
MTNMQERLLSSDDRDVTKPEQISIFNDCEEKKDVKIKPIERKAARKRIDTTEKFQMNQEDLKKIAFEHSENITRRDEFIKHNIENVTEQDETEMDFIDLNGDSFYGFRMTIDEDPIKNKHRIPVKLSWRNIIFKVMIKPIKGICNKKVEKIILNNISGDVQSGKLVAIMGPSGSGKTTLLNVISKRLVYKRNSTLNGSIIVNGVHRYELGKTFTNLTAFVQQDDILFNQQTVYETLMTAAKFSNNSQTEKDRQDLVESVIKELDLMHIRNTKIGDSQVRGVSGGERKRVNIATQMIRNPSLLFLDEPTSGLDSYQALKVVETLKKLCENGCTVITSIHQPRSSIFTLFDDIILLANGKLVYHGPSGDDALKYFAEKGYVCPAYFNPADFFLDLVSVDTRSHTAENKSRARIEYLVQEYAKEFEMRTVRKYTFNEYSTQLIAETNQFKESKSGQSTKVSKFSQLTTLSTRTFRQMIRDKRSFIVRIAMNIIFAVFISCVYYKTKGSKTQESIIDREGVLFFMCILQSMGPIINTVQGFCLEKSIVMRERQTRTYSLGIYYITTFISTIPIQIVFPVIFGAILYWIVGLNPQFIRFLWFLIITVLTNFSSIGLGFLCGCAAPSVEAATTIGQTLVALMILFSGFFIHVKSLPKALQWITYISTIRWSFMAFMINEFDGERGYKCDDGILACFRTGNAVLVKFAFDEWTKETSVIMIAVLLASFHVLAFIMLKVNRIKYMDVPPITEIELQEVKQKKWE